jgi:cbb3-type cytochrome oxidase subunit 3
VEYRTSTWQEQLRNYASYALLLVVILLSYGFYVFAYSGSTLQEFAAQSAAAVRDASRKATSNFVNSTTRALTATQSALFSEAGAEAEAEAEAEEEGEEKKERAANFLQ